jgi:hypothetical protein
VPGAVVRSPVGRQEIPYPKFFSRLPRAVARGEAIERLNGSRQGEADQNASRGKRGAKSVLQRIYFNTMLDILTTIYWETTSYD